MSESKSNRKVILIERDIVTEETIAATIYAQPCEKANICHNATRKCHEPIPYEPDMLTIPARRWMYCHGWKSTLGLVFVKDLGFHMLPTCPCCNADLIEHLKRKQQNP